MKKLIVFIILVIIAASVFCAVDYNKVMYRNKPIFIFKTNEYDYRLGKVYEYIGLGYKIIDATAISDYTNISVSTIFKKTKSFAINVGEKVDLRGYVQNRKVSGSLQVENNIPNETQYNEAWVDIDDNTIILDNKTGKITTEDSITDNVRLEIAFSKTYTDESPIRGVARFIIILD